MKRRLLTTLAVGVAAAALSATPALAAPPLPSEDNPRYPASQGYYFVDELVSIPAGSACSKAVTIRFVGHQRDYVNGELQPAEPTEEPPEPALGDTHVGQSPDEIMVLTAAADPDRTVTRKINGEFRDLITDPNEDGVLDLKSKGIGKNVFFGPGVKGILFADGKQWFTVTDALSPAGEIHINKTKGKTVELCNRIGLDAVPGKELPMIPEDELA